MGGGAMRRLGTAVLAWGLAAASGTTTAVAAPGVGTSYGAGSQRAVAAPACPTPASAGWRTGATSSPLQTTAAVRRVATGRHPCFDRFVVTITGSASRAGFYVGYVKDVTQDGSGTVVPLRGTAKLLVVAKAPAYDGRGRPTYRMRNPRELANVAGARTFRQVAWAGSFEGQTSFGLGVRAKLPFRAFVLSSGGVQRLVVDVSHT